MLEQRGQRHVLAPRAKQCTARALSRRDLHFSTAASAVAAELTSRGNAKAAVCRARRRAGRAPSGVLLALFAGLRQLFTQITNIIAAHRSGR